MAPWPSGKAKVCNTSTPSPNLGGASKKDRTPIGVLSFFAVTHQFRPAPCNLLCGIQFANSTKGRSALVWELLGEFSFRREPSGWHTNRCPVFFGGATQIRTGGRGVADLCLTTWPWRHIYLTYGLYHKKFKLSINFLEAPPREFTCFARELNSPRSSCASTERPFVEFANRIPRTNTRSTVQRGS